MGYVREGGGTDRPMTIYGLCDPAVAEIVRYVGKACDLDSRLAEHIREAKRARKRTHRINWILSLLRSGRAPVAQILDIVGTKEANAAERGYIRLLRAVGARLVNGTPGGDGFAGAKHSLESRRKLSESLRGHPALRAARLGCRLSEETCRRIGAALRGRKLTAEHVAKVAAAQRGKVVPVAARQKMSRAHAGVPLSAAHRASLSVVRRGHDVSHGTRLKISAALTGTKQPGRWSAARRERLSRRNKDHGIRPPIQTGRVCKSSTREKIAAAERGKVVSLESRQKMRIAHLGYRISEQQRAKISASLKRAYVEGRRGPR